MNNDPLQTGIHDMVMRGMGVVEICEVLGRLYEDDVWKVRRAMIDAGVEVCSPYGMVQERVSQPYKPWKVLVLCALMNRTHARQVRPVMGELFARWPTPADLAGADWHLETLIRPLGFGNQRSKNLREMSDDYRCGVSPDRCRGVGAFGRAAYAVFCLGVYDVKTEDGYLQKYVEWVREGRKV